MPIEWTSNEMYFNLEEAGYRGSIRSSLVFENGGDIIYQTTGDTYSIDPEDVFSITGRGTVITGRVSSGSIRVGDNVTILPSGVSTTITGIEQFRKMLDYAQAGDNVGLLLRGVSKEDVQRGNKIVR